jgi:alpha-tubulin suppressor-like RCC1 family protein
MSGILQALFASFPSGPRYRLFAWGNNSAGQLGINTGVGDNKSSPVQVSSSTWVQASAGGSTAGHSLAVKVDGTLWAWGKATQGQLGLNQGGFFAPDRSQPTQVGVLTNWSQVSAGPGSEVSGALKTDQTLWMWGGNSFGSIGDGTVINRSSPVQVGGDTNWAQLSVGGANVAAIKTTGTLWMWGINGAGQLGDNTTVSKSSPVQVGALTNWGQVSTSNGTHTLAVKTDGTLWAWGSNGNGGIGNGTTADRSSPVQIGALTNWSKVAASQQGNSLAVKTDGTLWAWGNNSVGQLGDNTTVSKSSPVQIGALTNWATPTAGGSVCGALKTDGTAWVWGFNLYGMIGDNTTVSKSSPVQVGSSTSWTNLGVSNFHTLAIEQG